MNNKIIQILIPIVAVVVIFESIMLVSNLEKSTNLEIANNITPTKTIIEKKINAFDVGFLMGETQITIEKKYKVSVKVTPKENYSLNALDLYVKYDPKMFTISGLTSSKNLETPILMKVSDKKDVIAVNYLFENKDGVVFTKDKEETILTFTITPKVVGGSYFEISTGDSDGDSVTMFVDKNTSKDLAFSSNKLEVLITK